MLFNSILSSGTRGFPMTYMKRVFIEAKDFQKKLDSLKDVDLLQKLQEAIAKNPEIGNLVKGTS